MKKISGLFALMLLLASCSGKENQLEPFVKPAPIVVNPEEGSTVYGIVSCKGKGVPGVNVTDGFEIVTTDKDGIYQLPSEKRFGIVYITVPSGYEAPAVGVVPQIKKDLLCKPTVVERKDFELKYVGDQTNHTMFVFGDMHLANKRSDIKQFGYLVNDLNNYIKDHSGEKVYGLTLGDMTWDIYWYANNFGFPEYLKEMNKVNNFSVYHTIGNHDHNMKTEVDGDKQGWDNVNWDCEKAFISNLNPTYYSFNIGKVHYIVLDDILCLNFTGGVSESRRYQDFLYVDNLLWLYKDLSYVDKSTPVVIALHCPVMKNDGSYYLQNAGDLLAALDGFKDVTFLSAHTLEINNININGYREYNSGAVCGRTWYAGYYHKTLNLGSDGAPGGYRKIVYNGTKSTSTYIGTGRPDNYQFRAYDRNCIKLDAASVGITKSPNKEYYEEYVTKYGGYDKASSANEIIIDVFDYDERWKIEVMENGNPLDVVRIKNSYDPLFLLAYTSERYKQYETNNVNATVSSHLFKATAGSATSTVEIKVTDDEGRVYTETMIRPKAFTIANYE